MKSGTLNVLPVRKTPSFIYPFGQKNRFSFRQLELLVDNNNNKEVAGMNSEKLWLLHISEPCYKGSTHLRRTCFLPARHRGREAEAPEQLLPVPPCWCWAEAPGCPAPSRPAWTAAGCGLSPSPPPPPAARHSRTGWGTSRSQTPAVAPPWSRRSKQNLRNAKSYLMCPFEWETLV